MKKYWAYLLILLGFSLAFYYTYSVLSGPRYSLYQIGKGIYQHDARLALAYVDLAAILKGQKSELVDILAPELGLDENSKKTVLGLMEAFMGPAVGILQEKLAQVIQDKERDNLPSSLTLALAAQITRNGDYALVLFIDPEKKRKLRLGMHKEPSGAWKVVEVDSRDLRALLDEYLSGQLDRG